MTESFSLAAVRKRLYKRLRALVVPLGHLTDCIDETLKAPCACDGTRIYWNRSFLPPDDGGAAALAQPLLLHELLHCLTGHLFRMPRGCPPEEWSLACDISAWHTALQMTPELIPSGIRAGLEEFRPQTGDAALYRPEEILPFLRKEPENSPAARDFRALAAIFSLDSHERWPVWKTCFTKPPGGRASGGGAGSEGSGDENPASREAVWKRLQKELSGSDSLFSPKREKNGRSIGTGTRSLRQAVTLTPARRHDYRALLKSLARWGEEIRVNEEEFPYAPYLYGLEHYGGLPLIEPLEYREARKIRELAIIIDTSASCSGTLTRAFLEETRNLLCEESLFFHPFCLHIIQCDVQVQRDDLITSPADLQDYIKHLEIRGMGGTDFRPAFSRVEALQKSREFTDLSGILVFTDGAGIYPDRKPDARCILVFLDRQYDPANLPRWAEILVLGGTATERNEY